MMTTVCTKIKSTIPILADERGLCARPGTKTKCPHCGRKTFSIKRDGSIGKCFHPSCGHFITPNTQGDVQEYRISKVLEQVYQDFHKALLAQEGQQGSCAYSYLVKERQIHPQVVADSMLGVVPKRYDLEDTFSAVINDGAEPVNKDKASAEEVRDKLQTCLSGHSGWLCFFYTDAYHRIVAIKFRQPYAKNFVYFKPFKAAGLFGHSLFSPGPTWADTPIHDHMIVTEGEFNQLQLQSLLLRHNEATDKSWGYINACAVGGVQNADFQTLSRIAAKPVICYDNDASEAGLQLVEKAREHLNVSAFTTPKPDSDLDDYIRSFEDRHAEAWSAVKELVENRDRYSKHFEPVAKQIYETRQKQGPKDRRRDFEINSETAQIVQVDLLERGYFCWDIQGAYFFKESEKKLISLDRGDPECTLLLANYGINPTESIYRYLVDSLWITARNKGTRTNVRLLSHYDSKVPVVHLYNHDNQIYRIGQQSINLVDNGSNGILFKSDFSAEPFKINKPDHSRSLLEEIILSKIPLAKDVLSSNERRLMLSIWFYSLFFQSIMPTKPILAFVGEKGSGKSSTLRRIGMLLFGSQFDVTPLPNKAEDFDAAVTNSPFVVVDNADSRCRWLEDRLATVATGGTIKKRLLYTTNKVVDIPVRCSLAITSRTPHFKRDDIADRLLIMKVNRLGSFKSEESLIREVLQNRDAIMTEVVYHIQEIVRALQASADRDDSAAFRMADFGSFAIKIARSSRIESQMKNIFHKITHEQSAFTLEGDPLFDLLSDWVEDHPGERISTVKLCQALSQMAQKRGLDFYYSGKERAFGQKLTKLKPNLEQFFDIEEERGHARTRHLRFKPKTQEARI